MRVAVISDIHANLPALEAAAEAIEREGSTQSGVSAISSATAPQPNECCAWTMEHAEVCLSGKPRPRRDRDARPGRLRRRRGGRGEVERGRARPRRTRRSSPASLPAPIATGSVSTTAALAIRSGSTCSRGRRPGTRSATRAPRSRSSATATSRWRSSTAAERGRPCAGRHRDRPAGGPLAAQPGLGRPAARRRCTGCLAAARPGGRHASFRRVPYDVERAQAAIREAGLPDALAERLAHGV